jgi:plastocyanin
MRKMLCALTGAVVLLIPSTAGATAPDHTPKLADSVPLFAGGGTFVSNGYFFPGTAVYQNDQFVGVPLQITQGQNIEFINTDVAAVTNAHQIVSFKRKHGRPLFQSALVKGPATATMIMQNVKPGLYPYFCNVHFGMYGLIEVTAP